LADVHPGEYALRLRSLNPNPHFFK
jgi:hypothetical protein